MTLQAILAGNDDRTIIKATSGLEALKYLLEENIAVILLVVKMDGMDGYQTAAMIRDREKYEGSAYPVLNSPPQADADIAKRYGYGAVDDILKPFVADVLCAKIAKKVSDGPMSTSHRLRKALEVNGGASSRRHRTRLLYPICMRKSSRRTMRRGIS